MTTAKALSILRSAIVNARIYPKGSQMVESSVTAAHEGLAECLKETPKITVSELEGKFLLNGKEAREAGDFRVFLTQHEVQSLTFHQGLERQEIEQLILILGKKKSQMVQEGLKTLPEWLETQGFRHVEANEVTFVALHKGETIVQKTAALIDQSSGDVPSLVGALEQAFQEAEQLPDEKEKNVATTGIAQHLAQSLPPTQLRDLFETQLPGTVEKAALKDQVVQALSRDRLEEVMEEIRKWHQQIKEQGGSEFEVVEQLNRLKAFLGKLLSSPASRQVSFAMFEEMLNIGLLDQIPVELQQSAGPSVLKQAEELLSKPSAELLNPSARQVLPDLLKALCGMGKDEVLTRLSDKMLENLSSPTPVVRQTAAKALRSFQDVFVVNRKEALLHKVVGALHQLAEAETVYEVYAELVNNLMEAGLELLMNWRFEECALLLSLLRRHAREETPITAKKREAARRVMAQFSERGVDTLCSDLNAPERERQSGAYRVLAELGAAAVPALIQAIKRSTDPRPRQAAVAAIKRLGSEAREELQKEIHLGAAADTLQKLLPLVEDWVDAAMLAPLRALQTHPDITVRRLVTRLLARISGDAAEDALAQFLSDPEVEVRREAVRLLAETKRTRPAPHLIAMLPTAPSTLQEDICSALVRIRDRRAVPVLAQLLTVQRSFFRRTPAVPESVRARAVWALGQFLPDGEARAALEKAVHDANPLVQRAAKTTLEQPPSQVPVAS